MQKYVKTEYITKSTAKYASIGAKFLIGKLANDKISQISSDIIDIGMAGVNAGLDVYGNIKLVESGILGVYALTS
jgi:hypothetical protein